MGSLPAAPRWNLGFRVPGWLIFIVCLIVGLLLISRFLPLQQSSPIATAAVIPYSSSASVYGLAPTVQQIVVTGVKVNVDSSETKKLTDEVGAYAFGNVILPGIGHASLQAPGIMDKGGQGCLHVGVRFGNLQDATYDPSTDTLRITLKRPVTEQEAQETNVTNPKAVTGYISVTTTCS